MPLPLLAAAGPLISAAISRIGWGFAAAALASAVSEVVESFLQSESGAAWVTSLVNERISGAGLAGLQFTNVTNRQAMIDDLDAYAAGVVNSKAGTSFAGIKALDREQFLSGVGAVVAQRLNSETGAHMANIYPVDTLRRELGTELARQFELSDLPEGGIFPRAQLLKVQAKVMKLAPGYKPAPEGAYTHWGPPRDEAHELQRAKNRARQARYRKKHKMGWVA